MAKISNSVMHRIGRYTFGILTLGIKWPKEARLKTKEASRLHVNPSSQTKVLEQNSIFKYYRIAIQDFGREKPPIEIVLRNAALKGIFQKEYRDGFLTFIDPNTNHTLVLDLNGKIISHHSVSEIA